MHWHSSEASRGHGTQDLNNHLPKTTVGHDQGIYIAVLGTYSAEISLFAQTNIFSRIWLLKFCLGIFTATTGIFEDTWQHTTEKHMELHKHLCLLHFSNQKTIFHFWLFQEMAKLLFSQCGSMQLLSTVNWGLCQLFHVP